MIAAEEMTQQDFYKGFLMARGRFDPADFGVNLPKDEFTDRIVNDFSDIYRGAWTINELLLHPTEAANFCNEVRRKHGYFDLPDDIILRVLILSAK